MPKFSADLILQPVTTCWCEAKMWRKFVLSVLLAVLMVQWVDMSSLPTPTANGEDPSSKELQYDFTPNAFTMMGKVNYSGRKYLTASVLNNLTILMDFQLQKTLEIAKDVLADPEVSGVNTEEMIKERSRLEKYVKKATKAAEVQVPPGKSPSEAYMYLTMSKGFMIEKFEEFVRYRNMSVSNPSRNDAEKVVWKTLLQHGLDEYHTEMSSRKDNFGTQFADDVLLYVGSLTPEYRQEKNFLVELCQNYEREEKADKVMFGYQLAQFFINV